jgi:hypothetical protein
MFDVLRNLLQGVAKLGFVEFAVDVLRRQRRAMAALRQRSARSDASHAGPVADRPETPSEQWHGAVQLPSGNWRWAASPGSGRLLLRADDDPRRAMHCPLPAPAPTAQQVAEAAARPLARTWIHQGEMLTLDATVPGALRVLPGASIDARSQLPLLVNVAPAGTDAAGLHPVWQTAGTLTDAELSAWLNENLPLLPG